MEIDNKLLAIVGVEGAVFRTSSAWRTMDRESYISMDDIQEHIHACSYSIKIQTHTKDTPTYKDVLHSTDEEHVLWYAAMTKELKSLRDLGYWII